MPEITAGDVLDLRDAVETIVEICHRMNAKWWIDPATGEDVRKNPLIVPTKLLMIISEITEAMEGDRRDLMDDKLPLRKALEVEVADALIRIGDTAAATNSPIAEALIAIGSLPRRAVGLALALRDIADMAGAYDLDLAGATADKTEFNLVRADHKPENRAKPGGKKY